MFILPFIHHYWLAAWKSVENHPGSVNRVILESWDSPLRALPGRGHPFQAESGQ
jgi:hypothetical protein